MSATEQAQRSGGPKPTRWDRLRDGLTFLGAWAIIGHQLLFVPPREVNEAFLVLAASLLGIPFGMEAAARLRSGGGNGITHSGSPSPSSE